MSKTFKQGKYSWPREYWSKRWKHAGLSWDKYGKRVTHRFERQQSKKIIESDLKAGKV